MTTNEKYINKENEYYAIALDDKKNFKDSYVQMHYLGCRQKASFSALLTMEMHNKI